LGGHVLLELALYLGRPQQGCLGVEGSNRDALEGERSDVLLRTPLRRRRKAQIDLNPGRQAGRQSGNNYSPVV
jgi:hypothetical protein